MQVMFMRLMSKGEYLIVPKGTKFTGSGKLGLNLKRFHLNFSGGEVVPLNPHSKSGNHALIKLLYYLKMDHTKHENL